MTITTAPRLRDELEVITGMDDMTLIFDPITGVYHRVSRSGKAVLTQLDGAHTPDQLVQIFRGDDVEAQASFRPQLDGFLAHLDRSGLLVGSALPVVGEREGRVRTSKWMPRVVVTRSLPRLLEPFAGLLRRTPLRLLGGLALCLAVTGFGAGITTLFTHGGVGLARSGWAFGAAAVLQLLLILVHESAHALVAQIQKVPVRGLGFAMLFWFMPVAYVDRTDAYRLRGKGGRVAIALAGMTSDGILCGFTAVAALATTGFWHDSFLLLLTLQLLGLMINLNPLLPSDGYSALESATGQVDFRGRSYALVRGLVTREPLPVHLQKLDWRQRAASYIYAVVSAGYILMAAFLLVLGLVHSTQSALAGVS